MTTTTVRRGAGPGKQAQRALRLCTIKGCGRKHRAQGLCPAHYQRMKVGADMTKPLRAYRTPGGGEYLNNRGYAMRYAPEHPNAQRNGCVLVHVAVMSEHLGRPLEKHEQVHHRNGERTDNRLSNLELWSTWQPRGQRVEDKVAWAKEVLALYEGTF